MANATTEPRALQAALAAPAFQTRGARVASRAADRHVDRWAPEAGSRRVGSLRSLGFVDRLVSPWIETAQRSASMRMFTNYVRGGLREREGGDVSWVFPRPWYQDELDWMAAARQQSEVASSYGASPPSSPALFTTRGTYVAPTQRERPAAAMPSELYEFVAPSLSVASPSTRSIASEARQHDAYSPLVPLAAVAAAQLMSRAMSPRSSPAVERPGLRPMLAAMLQRAAVNAEIPTRSSNYAPELVTPPAPRALQSTPVETTTSSSFSSSSSSSSALAEHYAAQRIQVVELQRIAEQSARRELAARVEAARAPEVMRAQEAARAAEAPRASVARGDVEARQRTIEIAQATERARVEERIAQRLAERRLHQESRATAADHARTLEMTPSPSREDAPAPRVPAEISAAIASLPPELASYLGARPERAAQAIAELNDVLRTAELLARTSASGGSFEVTRGPRLVMPAGLGGLIATMDRAAPLAPMPAQPSSPIAPASMAARRDVRVPAMSWLQPSAPRAPNASALSATAGASPAALSHVAWSDRWLARFSGASTRSLDVLKATSASPELRMEALAAAAPESVFVAPSFAPALGRAGGRANEDVVETSAPTHAAAPVQRFADDEETPDSVFEQIAASVATRRAPAPIAPLTSSRTTTADIDEPERFTYADAVVRGAPSAPGAGLSAQLASSPFAPALKHLLPLPASTSFDVRSLFGGGVSATYLAGLLAAESHEVDVASGAPAWARWSAGEQAITPMLGERTAPEFEATYVAPDAPRAVANDEQAPEVRDEQAPLTTLRTALLSWTADAGAAAASAPTIATTQSSPITHAAARAMVESMSLPMLGDAAPPEDVGGAWGMPGMIADRAHGWSVAQERSASDLSLDFVTPELVLAARVYGLGPAEAAQAARLALAGPGQLTAMAGAVDRTFVQALAIDAARREQRQGASAEGGSIASFASSDAAPSTASNLEVVRTQSSFGIERRAPRGAFLWPSASVGALGLSAASPDGQQSMSVAALELLAAQAVAELGTYAALAPMSPAAMRGELASSSAAGAGASHVTPSSASGDEMLSDGSGEAEVLSAASALVPSARRARFDALYVALSQAPNARTWSPAARAARALALAGRGEDAPPSAYERAAAAWDVLPIVFASDGATVSDATDQPTELAIARASRPQSDLVQVDGRPGLGSLAGRAGEALGSYVMPAMSYAPTTTSTSASSFSSSSSPSSASSSSSSSSNERETGAVLRAPTAAQELVRTGRPAGRHGGGEVEIPSWFEAAARKMLEDRSGNSDGISLAELTLVTAAPQAHIAASTRTASTGASSSPTAGVDAGGGGSGGGGEPIDVEKIANEVYRQILVMMDAARARNGEPYL